MLEGLKHKERIIFRQVLIQFTNNLKPFRSNVSTDCGFISQPCPSYPLLRANRKKWPAPHPTSRNIPGFLVLEG